MFVSFAFNPSQIEMPTLQVSGGKKNCSFPNRNTRARSSHFQFDSFSVAVDNCQLCLNSFESFRKEGRKGGLCGARSARESFVTDSPLYKYAPCNPTSLKAPWNSFLTKRTTALINIPTTTTSLDGVVEFFLSSPFYLWGRTALASSVIRYSSPSTREKKSQN